MIEVAEELVEAVVRRQHVIEVAKMVLAELSGRVALVLQRRSDGDDLLIHAGRRGWNADFRKAGAQHALPGDERRAPRGAGLLAVGVREHHPFLREAVDVGRLVAHQPVRIAAEIRDADVVTPDDEDVGLLRLGHRVLLSFAALPATSTCWPASFFFTTVEISSAERSDAEHHAHDGQHADPEQQDRHHQRERKRETGSRRGSARPPLVAHVPRATRT